MFISSNEMTIHMDNISGWLRNPASPNGCLKPKQNHGMFTIVFNW